MHIRRFRAADSARVIQVIETTGPVGTGEPGDEVRIVRQYWSLEGELLAVGDALFSELIDPQNQYDDLQKRRKEIMETWFLST